MTQEELDQWIHALESGVYRQGQEVLYSPEEDTYCCLGVLAALRGDLSDDMYEYPQDIPDHITMALIELNDNEVPDQYARVIRYLTRERTQAELVE